MTESSVAMDCQRNRLTTEERAVAWQRCAELRHQLELLLKGPVPNATVQTSQVRAELDDLEDQLAVDLIQQETAS